MIYNLYYLFIVLAGFTILALFIYLGTGLAKGLIRRSKAGNLRLDLDSFFSTLWLLAIAFLILVVSYYWILILFAIFGGIYI